MFHESQLLIYIAAYLIGSIPFGLMLTRAAGMGDIRKVGSGNIGATNVLRAGNKKIALLTLLLDAGKGYLAITIAHHYSDITTVAFAAGLCVVIGHCYPLWLKFKGGKGVATTFGVLFTLSPILGAVCAATWLAIFAASRFSSAAALLTMALMPCYASFILSMDAVYIMTDPLSPFILCCIALLIMYRHKSNMVNLFKGTEHKFGTRNDSAA